MGKMNKINIEIVQAPESKLGKQIGRGQCSQIFTWENSRVCKLFYEFMSPFNFENEYNVSVAAMSADIPVPAVHGAVQVGSRYGIIFDRIGGRNLDIETIFHFWKLEDYMKIFSTLQNQIHSVPAPDNLRCQHDVLEEWIGRPTPLSRRQRDAAASALKGLPEGRQLCHGDYHLGNVIQSQNGPSVIDWQTGYAGNPRFVQLVDDGFVRNDDKFPWLAVPGCGGESPRFQHPPDQVI